jgi:glucokinase
MIILAADVGGTTIKLGLVSDGDLLATHSLPAKADLSMINRLEAMARSWESLLTDLNLTTKDLDGVGLALPFLIDPAGTSVAGDFDKFHGADTIDFPKWTRERFGLPLILENDLRLALMGEWRQGVAQNQTDVVMLGLGTGIGCAALCGGRLLRGARNRAGAMLGHMTVALDMPRGRCGNFGCAEDLASTATLRDRAQEQPGFENSRLKADDALDFESLFEAVDAGDPCAQGMLEDCLKVWSTVALNIALAYDPAMVDTTEITRELADCRLIASSNPKIPRFTRTRSTASLNLVSETEIPYSDACPVCACPSFLIRTRCGTPGPSSKPRRQGWSSSSVVARV